MGLPPPPLLQPLLKLPLLGSFQRPPDGTRLYSNQGQVSAVRESCAGSGVGKENISHYSMHSGEGVVEG